MTMNRSVIPLIVLLGCQLASAQVAAQASEERPQLTLSIKVWNSSWASAIPTVYTGVRGNGTPGLIESLDFTEGGSKTATFPAISVRKGKVFAAGSFARYTGDLRVDNSAIIAPNGANIITARTDHLRRKESDLALGYLVSPNIAFTVGYKYATEKRDTALAITGAAFSPTYDYKVNGLILGGLANFEIHGPLRFYGQLGIGPARVKAKFYDPSIAASKSSARYLISEMGLNYALQITDNYIKGASVGLGYRSQVVRTKGIAPAYRTGRDYRDSKDGVIVSLNVAI